MQPELSRQDEPARERVLIDAARREAGEWRRTVLRRGPSNFRPGEEVFPGYDIIRELHRGGQGVVYEALQRSTHRRVAVKVLLAGALAGEAALLRFEREVRLLAKLRHPNIVVIHDSGIAQGCRFFVMDLIEGEHLHQYCRCRTLGVMETVRLFRHVVDAVALAHGNGVIHRDLKPTNIIVAEDGNPYVLDFGLAKVKDGSDGESLAASISATGDLLGTVRYMSPEQVSGQPDGVDTRTDVHALGVMLYESLTGVHPYGCGTNLSAMIDDIKRSDPPRISTVRPGIDAAVEEIILKSMYKEPDRRYPSALEMRQAIDDWIGRQESSPDPLVQPPVVSRGHVVRWGVVLAGCIILLLGALVAVSEWRRSYDAGTDRWNPRSAASESDDGLILAGLPRLTTTRSAPDGLAEPAGALTYVRQNCSLRGLQIQPVPGEEKVRIGGWLLNEAELRILEDRIASVREIVQLEAKVNPEAVRLLAQKALVEAGAKDVRVRLEGKSGDHRLSVEFSRTESTEQIADLAQEFVFDRSAIQFRGY